MAETIYTIPINEEFEERLEKNDCACPLCRLHKKLENDELTLILGASMMEPDVRIKTNRLGFCPTHFDKMLTNGKRLPLALMLESHLNEIYGETFGKHVQPEKAVQRLDKLEETCYICERAEDNFTKLVSNVVYMWETDTAFREKFESQKYFCLRHYKEMIKTAKKEMTKKVFKEFAESAGRIVESTFSGLCADVSWFCKKYDCRYEDEPWGNAKDSPERAIAFISGENK